jgi:HD-GYP domain-containing protein (c-di-GMP phosphodiesterase class II)
VAIARGLGLSSQEIEDIALGGELHDIGKIGVPEDLLHKPGSLTPEEHRRVMEHPVIGERILRSLLLHRPIPLAIVRWHHEWVSGQGLPDGLPGAATPLAARIIAVADAFDAMTSVRPYRVARTPREALRELEHAAEVQFDGDCVRAFASALEDDPQVRLIAP